MIEYIDIDHAQEMDEFVRQHEYAHFMQTSLWGRVKKDWGWHGVICRAEDGSIRGTMALLEHKVHYFKTGLLYAPRGPIVAPDDFSTLEELIDAGRQLAKKRGDYVFRFDPRIEEQNTAFSDEVRRLGFTQDMASDYSLFQPRMCYVTDLQGLTKDALLAKYRRSTRYNVRLAERRGVTVRVGTLDDLPEFHRMMKITAAKDHFEARPYQYFVDFLTGLGDAARLYIAEKDGKAVAATISTEYGNRMWHMYGCSDTACLSDRPNELLQWAMQSHAIDAGIRYFDYRGVEGYPVEGNPKYGLHDYKQGFGAEFHSYVGQFDTTVRPVMKKLVLTLQKFYHR